MTKQLSILFLAIASLSTAFAQEKPKFMGIASLPMTEESSPQLLTNAINAGDFNFIERWERERGLKFPYDHKTTCNANYLDEQIQLKPTMDHNKRIENGAIALSYNTPVYPFFTDCNKLPLFVAFKYVKDFKNSPNYLKITNKNKKSRSEFKVNTKNKMEEYTNFVNKIIDNLEPNQWDQLIPYIANPEIDYDLRLKATKKFVDLYKNKEMSEDQNNFIEAAKKYEVDPKTAHNATSRPHYKMGTEPIHFLHRRVLGNVLGAGGSLNKSPELMSLLSKDYFLGKKKVTIEDIDKSGAKNNEKASALKILTAKEIIDELATLKEFDINKQDSDGDTFLHDFLDTKHGTSHTWFIRDNRVIANWIRAYLEKGYDPMLLNKNKKSAYMMFEEIRNSSSTEIKYDHSQIIEAFTLKEYNY